MRKHTCTHAHTHTCTHKHTHTCTHTHTCARSGWCCWLLLLASRVAAGCSRKLAGCPQTLAPTPQATATRALLCVQARIADLTCEAEKLPALRQQLVQFQAAVANVRALETRLAAEQRAHPGEGELLTRCAPRACRAGCVCATVCVRVVCTYMCMCMWPPHPAQCLGQLLPWGLNHHPRHMGGGRGLRYCNPCFHPPQHVLHTITARQYFAMLCLPHLHMPCSLLSCQALFAPVPLCVHKVTVMPTSQPGVAAFPVSSTLWLALLATVLLD